VVCSLLVYRVQAAGVATIAHKSGGPQSDIVVPHNGEQTGWLAASAEEYADCMAEILDMATSKPRRLEAIVKAARASVARFSDKEFSKSFLGAVSVLFERYE
jgi:alpha-1,2-mannosyltransferase